MLRFEGTKIVLRHIGDGVIVSNLGPTTDELWHAGHRHRNFYTYGAMGLCSSIALGMALSIKEKGRLPGRRRLHADEHGDHRDDR